MIWFKKYSVADLQAMPFKKSLMDLLGLNIIEIADDYLRANLPVDSRTHQVDGILHGGATCVLVETAGSFASRLCLDPALYSSVGSFISVNHLRPMTSGIITALCKPIHLGKSKHVWDIPVYADDSGKLVAKGELTCAVIKR